MRGFRSGERQQRQETERGKHARRQRRKVDQKRETTEPDNLGGTDKRDTGKKRMKRMKSVRHFVAGANAHTPA